MSNVERNGWRDEWISDRHRKWGKALTMNDIDFFVIEHLHGTPAALVEYKEQGAYPVEFFSEPLDSPKQCNYNSMKILADNSKIPFFIVFYWSDSVSFMVYPVNQYAADMAGHEWYEKYTEKEYVTLLYKTRLEAATNRGVLDCSWRRISKDLRTTMHDDGQSGRFDIGKHKRTYDATKDDIGIPF